MKTTRRTHIVTVRDLKIGTGYPVAVQSMTATPTRNVDATLAQIERMVACGADLVRIAVDSKADVAALRAIRTGTRARLVVDLQESYRLVGDVAPYVDKVRYNPGHLYHHEKTRSVADKVRHIVDIARDFGLALRIGVNCGSVDPDIQAAYPGDHRTAMLASALKHCHIMDDLGFTNYLVSLKDSNPLEVIAVNKAFAQRRPDVPLHLGVTEAGMPPDGIVKTRLAFEPLLAAGIGETIRVSLTLPNDRKHEEIIVGHALLDDIRAGRFLNPPTSILDGLNIISCPSCSRVENERFVELARQVKARLADLKDLPLTIAVMGCRVNGPGETDAADIGIWCGPEYVNLKRRGTFLGHYRYDEILDVLEQEIRNLRRESDPVPSDK